MENKLVIIPLALVEAPNGMTYAVDSTLPREEIKALAEELMLLQ